MSRAMGHEEISELLGAYALHAVDPEEAALVEEHLQTCPRCRAEVAEHREVAALLGNSGGDAPDGLWDRIAESIDGAAPPMRLSLPMPMDTVTPLRPARRPANRFVLGALGAAAALVIAVLGVRTVQQCDELDRLSAALADDAMLTAANLALVDPDAAQTTLRSPDGTLGAAAVVLPDGTGYLLSGGLPELAADRTYQLWGQTSGGLVSLGVLGADPGDVVAFRASGPIAALALTEEASGGVIQSQNAPVVLGRLD